MSVSSDLDKGTTLGDPDGPDEFIPSLGITVPTFISERADLALKGESKFKRLSYHVPFAMRGEYRPDQLPEEFLQQIAGQIKVDTQGYVICAGFSKKGPCLHRAQNRSNFCRNHGGALHLADKKMSAMTTIPSPANRVAALDRCQQFMQGFLTVDQLADDEIQGGYVRNDEGIPISSGQLGMKFEAMLSKELHNRLNRFLKSKAPSMLDVMVNIAESDLVEPADRIKAAIWVSERVMGKTPEVLITAKTEAPYETIFETVESGSRDHYRKIQAQRAIEMGAGDIHDAEVVDDEDVEYEADDSGQVATDGDSGSIRVSSESDLDDSSRRNADDSESVPTTNTGIRIDDPRGYAQSVIDRKNEAKELRTRLAKAKRRRFAARANGAGLGDSPPWLIDWAQAAGGLWVARVVAPSQQSQRVLDKIKAEAQANQGD